MRYNGLNRFCALTGACVALSLIATTGWSQTLTWLGTLGGNYSLGLGVSADGSVVVGYARTDTFTDRAFRWTAARGMEDLDSTYSYLLNGSDLSWPQATSSDGRYIVGRSLRTNPSRHEAFLLDTGAPRRDGDVDGNGCVDDADLLQVLFNFGSGC